MVLLMLCISAVVLVLTVQFWQWSYGLWVCRLQDQLIIFMALGQGESNMLCTEPTLHTRTAMVVAEQLTAAKFEVHKPVGNKCWQIHCIGAAVPVDTTSLTHI